MNGFTEQRSRQTLKSGPGLGRGFDKLLKGLILAQNERWRRGLGMQVERIPQGGSSVRGSNAWVSTLGSGIALREKG